MLCKMASLYTKAMYTWFLQRALMEWNNCLDVSFSEDTKCLLLLNIDVVHWLALFFCVYQDKSKDSVFGGDYSTLDRLDTTSTNSESKVRVVDEHGSEIDYDDDLDDRMKKVQAFE